jgi:hypothetical protein
MQSDDRMLSGILAANDHSRRNSYVSVHDALSGPVRLLPEVGEEDRQLMALQGGFGQLRGGMHQAAQVAAAANAAANADGNDGASVSPDVLKRLGQMEAHAASMLQQLEAKDKQLARERKMLQRFRELEQQVEMQLRAVTSVRSACHCHIVANRVPLSQCWAVALGYIFRTLSVCCIKYTSGPV